MSHPTLRQAVTTILIASGAVLPAIAQQPLTAREIIAKIEQRTSPPWSGQTVDTFKAGDPDTPVTGIATAFTDTYDVLERAVDAGANLIVSHEPSFYNHLDDTKALASDPVYRAKMAYIDQHHLVVFRFHDHWHAPAMKPDGIMTGMMHALDWEQFHSSADPMMFLMPETTLERLAAHIRESMKIRTLRVIGDPGMKFTHVAFIPGAAGAERQIQALERPDVELLVVGEAREWETVEYVRDAVYEHKKKALILMGHDVSEEAGMSYCADWLKTFLPGIPVTYVPAGEPFWTIGSGSGMR